MGASVLVKSPYVRRQYVLIFVDALIILATIVLAHFIGTRFNVTSLAKSLPLEARDIVITLLAQLTLLYIFDLYNVKSFSLLAGRLVRIAISVSLGTAVSAVIFYIGRLPSHLVVFFIQVPLLTMTIYTWRELFYRLFLKNPRKRRVLLIGDDPLNTLIYKEVVMDPIADYEVVCLVSRETSRGSYTKVGNCLMLDNIKLDEVTRCERIDVVVFSLQALEEFAEELLHLKALGMESIDSLTFYKLLTGRVPIVSVSDSMISCLSGKLPMPSYYKNVKRLIDIALSLFGIIVSFPAMALASLLVWLESPGPIFFKPERIGENGKPLKLYKLRTMYHTREGQQGPLFTQDHDTRITRVGKLLRKTGLDEFPQLLNVLRGEMSLIGPRPIEQVYVEKYIKKTPLYYLRISMKPGISGWAQVTQTGYPNTDWAQLVKLQYDLFYISHASLFLDIVIILKTMKKFFNFGAHDKRTPHVMDMSPQLEHVDDKMKKPVLILN
jgi:exopolysaccharide biosynthesis polyprenyl glycosylphosphotransferase